MSRDPWVRGGLLGFFIFFPVCLLPQPAVAQEMQVSAGIKVQYVSLTRSFKAGPDRRRVESPQSSGIWAKGGVLNFSFDRWVLGASVMQGILEDFEGPLAPSGVIQFRKGVEVGYSEWNAGVGYTVLPGIVPYLAYFRHEQITREACLTCIDQVDFSAFGPGLLLQFPNPTSRWSIFINAAQVSGLSVEAGVSYSAIRTPLVGVVGYSYRRLDYSGGGESCSHPGVECFRTRDVFAGPVMSLNYVF